MCILHIKNGSTMYKANADDHFRAAHIPSCTRHTHRMPCHSMNRYEFTERYTQTHTHNARRSNVRTIFYQRERTFAMATNEQYIAHQFTACFHVSIILSNVYALAIVYDDRTYDAITASKTLL